MRNYILNWLGDNEFDRKTMAMSVILAIVMGIMMH